MSPGLKSLSNGTFGKIAPSSAPSDGHPAPRLSWWLADSMRPLFRSTVKAYPPTRLSPHQNQAHQQDLLHPRSIKPNPPSRRMTPSMRWTTATILTTLISTWFTVARLAMRLELWVVARVRNFDPNLLFFCWKICNCVHFFYSKHRLCYGGLDVQRYLWWWQGEKDHLH